MPSEPLHRRDAVSKLLLESWDGFTTWFFSIRFRFTQSKGSECMPTVTLHRRDAVSKPPWMGSRRVSEGIHSRTFKKA